MLYYLHIFNEFEPVNRPDCRLQHGGVSHPHPARPLPRQRDLQLPARHGGYVRRLLQNLPTLGQTRPPTGIGHLADCEEGARGKMVQSLGGE